MSLLPDYWVSIDPGDRHVGFSTWHNEQCVNSIEVDPNECVRLLEVLCSRKVLEVVVCEKWMLYAWNEKSLAGNEFLTSQLIGVIKYLCARNGIEYVGQTAAQGKSTYRTSWYKEMSRRELMKLPWWGHGDHAKDSWAHGRFFVHAREQSLNGPPKRTRAKRA